MLTDMRDAFFEELLKAARVRPELMFLTADHGAHALEQFQVELPDRFINVGISEQNMIGVAAGLASRGKVVFAYGIAPFVSLRKYTEAKQLPLKITKPLIGCRA